jgi:hypothetical protein
MLVSKEEHNENKKKFKILFTEKVYPEDYSISEVSLIRYIIYQTGQHSVDTYKKEWFLFGSNTYIGNIYAGDIDIYQIVEKKNQASVLQQIIDNIIKKVDFLTSYFIGDIKCGLTQYRELKNYIGSYDFKKNKPDNKYNPKELKFLWRHFGFDNIEQIKDKPTIEEYLKLKYEIHQLITRRWTYTEVLQGFQLEPDGYTKYSLDEGIYESELTKIDLYGGELYMSEATNVLMSEEDNKKALKLADYSVYENLMMCVYVKKDYFKALKRLYALCRKKKEYDLAVLLHKFCQVGDNAIFNYSKGLMNIAYYIIENYYKKFTEDSYEALYLHYEYIATELQRIFNIKNKVSLSTIERITYGIQDFIVDGKLTEEQINEIKDITENFDKTITDMVNKDSIRFIEEHKIDFHKYLYLIEK